MRLSWLTLPALAMLACGQTGPSGPSLSGGRYQQVTNPPPIFCPASNGNTLPEPGCGIIILDTQTGTIFIHRAIDWQEENPHTGKITIHDLN